MLEHEPIFFLRNDFCELFDESLVFRSSRIHVRSALHFATKRKTKGYKAGKLASLPVYRCESNTINFKTNQCNKLMRERADERWSRNCTNDLK